MDVKTVAQKLKSVSPCHDQTFYVTWSFEYGLGLHRASNVEAPCC